MNPLYNSLITKLSVGDSIQKKHFSQARLELNELLKELSLENIYQFSQKILQFICKKTAAYQGVFLGLDEKKRQLSAKASFGITNELLKNEVYSLEVGSLHTEVYLAQYPKIFRSIPSQLEGLSFGSLQIEISSLYILPLIFNNKVLANLELVYFVDLSTEAETFLLEACETIAGFLISIHNTQIQQDFLLEAQLKNEVINEQKDKLVSNLEEILNAHEKLSSQKKIIESTLNDLEAGNKRLLQSLNYAKRIQEIILPAEAKLTHTFSEHFVIYFAKDIVSGDFYWFNRSEISLLGVFDCTGHGVPGAFMTMIGYTLLNEIVNVKRVQDPAEILQLLHEGIRTSLKQDEKDNSDGMEAALCRIELTTDLKVKLTFAGAKRSIYYWQNNELHELKGDREYLGGGKHRTNKLNFTAQSRILDYGDTIYMFTDGITDTCNPNRDKFSAKRLKEILSQNAYISLEQQQQIILTQLIEFMQGEEQRDDITMLGIKL